MIAFITYYAAIFQVISELRNNLEFTSSVTERSSSSQLHSKQRGYVIGNETNYMKDYVVITAPCLPILKMYTMVL